MKNLPKKYIESMMDAQSQIIAQQKEIEQLKEGNTKLKEEIKQYIKVNDQLTDKIVELNG